MFTEKIYFLVRRGGAMVILRYVLVLIQILRPIYILVEDERRDAMMKNEKS